MQRIKTGEAHQLRHTWSSANEAVATVDSRGRVKAVAPGTVEIYCTVDGLSVATIVTVVEPPPEESPDV